MSHPYDGNRTPLLADAVVTARMNPWLLVEAFDEACLFGFADEHPSTGGLSWLLSTRVIEFTASEDRARTASGRVYQLGRRITIAELDEEGRVALRGLRSSEDYPGRADDVAWVTARKMARHLGLISPPYADHAAVDRFLERYRGLYLEHLRKQRRVGG